MASTAANFHHSALRQQPAIINYRPAHYWPKPTPDRPYSPLTTAPHWRGGRVVRQSSVCRCQLSSRNIAESFVYHLSQPPTLLLLYSSSPSWPGPLSLPTGFYSSTTVSDGLHSAVPLSRLHVSIASIGEFLYTFLLSLCSRVGYHPRPPQLRSPWQTSPRHLSPQLNPTVSSLFPSVKLSLTFRHNLNFHQPSINGSIKILILIRGETSLFNAIPLLSY